jgi:integrase
MSFAQAQQAVKGPRIARGRGDLTVGDAMTEYLDFLEADGRSAAAVRDARYKAEALILPALGSSKVATLTPERLRRWRDQVVTAAPRLRTRKGEPQQYRELPDDEDGRRARRATAHRTWSTLRAALNHAFRDGKIESDAAWRRVTPFRKVNSARVRYLTVAEARRLINASDVEFRPLVQAALATGARYSELCRLTAGDFNSDVGTLAIRRSKFEPRHIVLTEEGRALFAQLAAGRTRDEFILRKANGKPWGTSHQRRPMLEACLHAGIVPPAGFHCLRHTWASLSVMAGMPLMVVAKNLGHADTRMVETYYGHLAPSYVADAIRSHAPRFGMPVAGNVRPI